MAATNAMGAFLSVWTKARATFGVGPPQPGASYDRSATLTCLADELGQAAPTRYWSGRAATAYATANTEHGHLLHELGMLDRRLAEQVDQSARIVAAGRSNLDAIRAWVVAAAASLPKNEVRGRMLAPIVCRGLAQLANVVTRANTDLNTVGDNIATIGAEFQALGAGQRFGDIPESPAPDRGEPEPSDRNQNQIAAFRDVFGRTPVSDSDWLTAAALDPTSYDAKNEGVAANVVVGRINPVPGQGVVRTNLFIPSKDVWAPAFDWPPYDNNLGDNRGFSSTAGPEASRVSIYTDFDNGIVVARQNPSINADTGQVHTGTPSIAAVQTSDGGVLIKYNAADPFSPGGEGLAKGTGISVNGTLGVVPSETGPRVGGEDVTTFPALEIYNDCGGTTTTVLQAWPTFFDNAAGPMTGLLFDRDVGDPTVVPSFNNVVPQILSPVPSDVSEPASVPMTPPMSIVPPGNFTPFGPAADAPTVRVYTPLHGSEFLSDQ
ncbi:EspA/EspE family type VII secretion system effector [Mycolicibacterium sp.]|uniref:EspA/EspE family type VII secretion system effector n=1 Tax=Mycolicibacterium sp. TaxID=2320850 RepID=UPI003D0A8FDC